MLDAIRDLTLKIQKDQRGANWVVVRAGGVFGFAAANERENSLKMPEHQ